MKILCVIPCRLASVRLPRKPLLMIQGKPMIQWTYENAKRTSFIDDVIVATDSPEILALIHSIGGKAMLTNPNLDNGTLRVAEVAKKYSDLDLVINLQGDEPFIKPDILKQLINPYLNHENPVVSTLAYPLDPKKYSETSVVKVITDLQSHAIYFSRSAIPFFRAQGNVPCFNHMGIYAFTPKFLHEYPKLPPTPLEKVECLEQLRIIEHGFKIKVSITEDKTLDINTPADYEKAQHYQYQS